MVQRERSPSHVGGARQDGGPVAVEVDQARLDPVGDLRRRRCGAQPVEHGGRGVEAVDLCVGEAGRERDGAGSRPGAEVDDAAGRNTKRGGRGVQRHRQHRGAECGVEVEELGEVGVVLGCGAVAGSAVVFVVLVGVARRHRPTLGARFAHGIASCG